MEFKINLYIGSSIEKAIEQLKDAAVNIRATLNENRLDWNEYDKAVTYGDFNGTTIYSTDTINEAYLKIRGKSKQECDEEYQQWKEDYDRKEKEWKDSIPEKIPFYQNLSRGVIREDKYELWDEIVPARLNDLYHGMELGATIDILAEWNESHSPAECRKIMEGQGHSGMSHALVLRMIYNFAKGDLADVEKLCDVLNE